MINRPDKRNAMSPQVHLEMDEVLDELAVDPQTDVLVLTGAGNEFCAGGDVRVQAKVAAEGTPETPEQRTDLLRASMEASRLLHEMPKPTIAMVNGWCFGGGFNPVISCDIALAAEDATFGLSEVNWGIIPAGNVLRSIASKMRHTDGLYYALTGDTFNGTDPAPGANDDGSGTAVSLECARVLSKYKFPATIVFLTVAGEEQVVDRLLEEP